MSIPSDKLAVRITPLNNGNDDLEDLSSWDKPTPDIEPKKSASAIAQANLPNQPLSNPQSKLHNSVDNGPATPDYARHEPQRAQQAFDNAQDDLAVTIIRVNRDRDDEKSVPPKDPSDPSSAAKNAVSEEDDDDVENDYTSDDDKFEDAYPLPDDKVLEDDEDDEQFLNIGEDGAVEFTDDADDKSKKGMESDIEVPPPPPLDEPASPSPSAEIDWDNLVGDPVELDKDGSNDFLFLDDANDEILAEANPLHKEKDKGVAPIQNLKAKIMSETEFAAATAEQAKLKAEFAAKAKLKLKAQKLKAEQSKAKQKAEQIKIRAEQAKERAERGRKLAEEERLNFKTNDPEYAHRLNKKKGVEEDDILGLAAMEGGYTPEAIESGYTSQAIQLIYQACKKFDSTKPPSHQLSEVISKLQSASKRISSSIDWSKMTAEVRLKDDGLNPEKIEDPPGYKFDTICVIKGEDAHGNPINFEWPSMEFYSNDPVVGRARVKVKRALEYQSEMGKASAIEGYDGPLKNFPKDEALRKQLLEERNFNVKMQFESAKMTGVQSIVPSTPGLAQKSKIKWEEPRVMYKRTKSGTLERTNISEEDHEKTFKGLSADSSYVTSSSRDEYLLNMKKRSDRVAGEAALSVLNKKGIKEPDQISAYLNQEEKEIEKLEKEFAELQKKFTKKEQVDAFKKIRQEMQGKSNLGELQAQIDVMKRINLNDKDSHTFDEAFRKVFQIDRLLNTQAIPGRQEASPLEKELLAVINSSALNPKYKEKMKKQMQKIYALQEKVVSSWGRRPNIYKETQEVQKLLQGMQAILEDALVDLSNEVEVYVNYKTQHASHHAIHQSIMSRSEYVKNFIEALADFGDDEMVSGHPLACMRLIKGIKAQKGGKDFIKEIQEHVTHKPGKISKKDALVFFQAKDAEMQKELLKSKKTLQTYANNLLTFTEGYTEALFQMQEIQEALNEKREFLTDLHTNMKDKGTYKSKEPAFGSQVSARVLRKHSPYEVSPLDRLASMQATIEKQQAIRQEFLDKQKAVHAGMYNAVGIVP